MDCKIEFKPPKLKNNCEHHIVWTLAGTPTMTGFNAETREIHGVFPMVEKCSKCGGHTGEYRNDVA